MNIGTLPLTKSGSVVGVDSSPAMLQLARTRCAGRENVVLLDGEVTALPVESGTFDGTLCVQVLEYVADVDAALAELHQALRPGGRAVVWDVDWATVNWDNVPKFSYRYESANGAPRAQEEFDRRREAGEPAVMWRFEDNHSPPVLVDQCNL